jgi:glycosyltransferase involved in cell wall biosynthesis
VPPCVSLSLPVYNGERDVATAIQSLLDQSFADFELIITDNASTDATQRICEGFAARDGRIRYVRNDRNLGAAGNFNLGFKLASGQYFKWCAHDDFISVDFLQTAVRTLEADPGAVVACGRLQGVDGHGAPTRYVETPLEDMSGVGPARRFRILLSRHGVDAASFGLMRSSALAKSSLHVPYYGSDCALLAELALLGTFVQVPDATLYNREHPRRSVNIHSNERLVWQNPNAVRGNAFELCNRIAHLVEIARRHQDAAPLHQTLAQLVAWASSPVLLARCALEVIGAVSPSLRGRLRSAGLAVMGRLGAIRGRRIEVETGGGNLVRSDAAGGSHDARH